MSEMYDDTGDEQIPWKPPVIAAIIGAFLVASFVIWAIVTGPLEDPEADALLAQPVPSTDLPVGYTPLGADSSVGIKVESVTRDGGSSTVVVSSAVKGMTDPLEAPSPDVAYWEFGPEDSRTAMGIQYTSNGAAGTTTIVFPTEATPSEASVVAYLVAATASAETEIEVSPDTLGQPVAFVLDIEGGSTIAGQVTIGQGWGTVEWAAPEGMAAALYVEATFVGTANPAADVFEPIRLIPMYDPALARPGTVITPRPLYGSSGSYGLYGQDRPESELVEVESIVIRLEGTVVTETSDPIILTP